MGSYLPTYLTYLTYLTYRVFRYSTSAQRSASVKTCGSAPARDRYGPWPVLRLPGFEVSNSNAPWALQRGEADVRRVERARADVELRRRCSPA